MKCKLVLLAPAAISLAMATPLARAAESLPPAFAAFDIDRDGALSPQEVGPVIRRDFQRLDLDGGGALEIDELQQPLMVELMRQRSTKVPVTEPRISKDGPSFADVGAYLEETVELGELAGIAIRVDRGGELLYEHAIGDLDPDTVVPVASGSKWMTAALLMTLVDAGELRLDGPLSEHLPYLENKPAAPVTLRQALSHTAGFGSEHLLNQPFDMDLSASAKALSDTELETEPGTTFHYTGVAMQLAAAAAESVTERPWSELFTQRIARPIGMAKTAYGHPMRPIDFAENSNQIAESGVHTTLRDYARFLEMIAGSGVYRGKRILSAEAIDEMERNQAHGLAAGFTPAGGRADWGYGLGLWCMEEAPDQTCTLLGSPGAMGTYPWVDRVRGIQGVVVVVDRLPRLADRIGRMRELVEQVIDHPSFPTEAAGGDARTRGRPIRSSRSGGEAPALQERAHRLGGENHG